MTKSILLVDDDVQFRNLVVPILKEHGYRIVQAGTGLQAMDALQFGQFDAAIVDGQLPDSDGIDLIGKLRQRSAAMKIVYISAQWRDASSYNRLTNQLNTSLILHKPIMPLAFGLQIDGLFFEKSSQLSAASQTKVALQLAALSAHYTKALPAAIAELNTLIRQAYSQSGNLSVLNEAITCAHKVRGTAGTYGMPEIGVMMGAIEDALREIVSKESGYFVAEEVWPIIFESLEAVRKAGERILLMHTEVATETGKSLPRILVALDESASDYVAKVSSFSKSDMAEFVIAKSWTAAYEHVAQDKFDACLAEITSASRKSAFTLSRKMRDSSINMNAPLALIAGEKEVIDKSDALYTNIPFILRLPFSAEDLQQTVTALVIAGRSPDQHVLVVDDDSNFSERVQRLLENEDIAIRCCTESVRAIEEIEANPPDLLLLDLDMPVLSGFDIINKLRTNPRWKNLTIIFVTSRSTWEVRSTAYSSGVNDFLTKPIVDVELRATVNLWLENIRLNRERDVTDPLTKLPLHRTFVEKLSSVLPALQNKQLLLTIALLDVVNMKGINETFGVVAGDTVLSQVGNLIKRRFRPAELRTRWNGQQFAIAFPGQSIEVVAETIDKLNSEFQDIPLLGGSGISFPVKCRTALVSWPSDGDSVYDLMKEAELSLKAPAI